MLRDDFPGTTKELIAPWPSERMNEKDLVLAEQGLGWLRESWGWYGPRLVYRDLADFAERRYSIGKPFANGDMAPEVFQLSITRCCKYRRAWSRQR